MQEATLRRDIGEVVGRYQIGGIPTVLAHKSYSKLVNFHEQTHNIDVSTTLFGYGLKRTLAIEMAEPSRGIKRLWSRQLSNDYLKRSWGTFEGHASFNEFLYLYINDPEALNEWKKTLPSSYSTAFENFRDLILPIIQPYIHLLDCRYTRFQKLMFGQLVATGIAGAALDHAFASRFEDIRNWSQFESRLNKSVPDRFLAESKMEIANCLQPVILALAKDMANGLLLEDFSNNRLETDSEVFGRKIKSTIWHEVSGGVVTHCQTGDPQLDLIDRIEDEIIKKYPSFKKTEIVRGGVLIGEVTSDFRDLPIERSVKVEDTDSEQELFDRIAVGMLAEDRFRVVLSVWSGFGEDADKLLLGVHDLRRIEQPVPTIKFEPPILFGLNQSTDFLKNVDHLFYCCDPEISKKSNLIFLGTYTGVDGKVGGMEYFSTDDVLQLKGPKYVVVSQFSLSFFRDLASISESPPSYEIWAIDQHPHRIDIALARFSDFTVFWAGAGLIDAKLPRTGEILTLGGIDFVMRDIHEDQDLAAAVFCFTHNYSNLLSMKVHDTGS